MTKDPCKIKEIQGYVIKMHRAYKVENGKTIEGCYMTDGNGTLTAQFIDGSQSNKQSAHTIAMEKLGNVAETLGVIGTIGAWGSILGW